MASAEAAPRVAAAAMISSNEDMHETLIELRGGPSGRGRLDPALWCGRSRLRAMRGRQAAISRLCFQASEHRLGQRLARPRGAIHDRAQGVVGIHPGHARSLFAMPGVRLYADRGGFFWHDRSIGAESVRSAGRRLAPHGGAAKESALPPIHYFAGSL